MKQEEPTLLGDTAAAEALEEEIKGLKPELQPVARRHGMTLLRHAVILSALNVLMDQLQAASNRTIKPLIGALVNTQADLIQMMLAEHQWTWDQLAECIGDIARAAQVAAAAREAIASQVRH